MFEFTEKTLHNPAHPEVLTLSRKWTDNCFQAIYNTSSKENKQWVYYYTYVELCISFANAVFYGRDIHLLDNHAYEYHYQPLVKLLLTEHYPYIASIRHGKYISKYIKEYMDKLEGDGWNWSERHLMLANE